MKKMQVKIKKLDMNAIIPKYQTKGSAGFDVHALFETGEEYFLHGQLVNCILKPGERKTIRTGLAFSLPENYELQIRPRSGLAVKHGITITNSPGTLDSDYIMELLICLHNLGDKSFAINNGDRIAQCILAPVTQAKFIEVKEFSDEDINKDRGGGFGSTGVGTEKMIKYGEKKE